MKIQTILCSVTDKSGLVDFANGLPDSVEWIASGGTAKTLQNAGFSPTTIEEKTFFPECFGGRVKTLHPNIAGAILYRRGIDDQEAKELGITPIEMVICNLYNFAGAAQDPNLSVSELIESMDIGGSTLIRAAAKNYKDVCIVVYPSDYPSLLEEMQKNQGSISLETRERLAVKALHLSAEYESLLSKELALRLSGEETRRPHLSRGKTLRYGENPDQRGWVFAMDQARGLPQAEILSGKELSYNNYEDATVAYRAVQHLYYWHRAKGVAIIKHGCPCGYATGSSLIEAFRLAWAGDAKSAFGSVIATTESVTEELVEELKGKFIEVIVAPSFSSELITWCREKKPNLRLIQLPLDGITPYHYKTIAGGMLVQSEKKSLLPDPKELFCKKEKRPHGVVTKNIPDDKFSELYGFAVAAVHFAKSNAVAIVKKTESGACQLLGMGAGQPNRVDCLERLALPKAKENLQSEDLSECVAASDGFFPFRDSIDALAAQGIKHCIQPGGSKRDPEVIEAADEHGMSMVFTGQRYFTH